jgi:hypothetical protein
VVTVVILDDALRKEIVRSTEYRTDAYIMDRFGISYNTFRKIESCLPIRESLAVRLRMRLASQMENADLV